MLKENKNFYFLWILVFALSKQIKYNKNIAEKMYYPKEVFPDTFTF